MTTTILHDLSSTLNLDDVVQLTISILLPSKLDLDESLTLPIATSLYESITSRCHDLINLEHALFPSELNWRSKVPLYPLNSDLNASFALNRTQDARLILDQLISHLLEVLQLDFEPMM